MQKDKLTRKGGTAAKSNIKDITRAAEEQASSIEQINGVIDKIAHVAQSNSEVSEESTAASEELTAQTETLDTMIRRFALK